MNILFIDIIPEILEQNTLYISRKYNLAIHLCACGCDFEVATPFNSDDKFWTLIENDELVSLEPSIGNWQIPCRSHYYIRNNQIEWCY